MAIKDLVVKLELDDGKFTGKIENSAAAVRHLMNTIEKTGGKMKASERHVRSWGTTFRDAVLTMGLIRHALLNLDTAILGIPRSIIRANAELERMQALMRGLSSETSNYAAIQKEASKGIDFVFDASKASPFDVKTITDSFVKFRSAGIDPTNGSLQALIDSVAKFGGTSDQMHRAAIAIQQMAGKGVISLEELRQQLGESVPDAMMIMARSLDVSLSKLVAMISTGSVKSTGALQAMFRQMAIENMGAAAEMAQTWDGTMNRMRTQWVELSKVAGDASFFKEAKDNLSAFVDGFMASAEAVDAMKKLGQVLGSLTTVLSRVASFTYEYGEYIAFFASTILLGKFIPAWKETKGHVSGFGSALADAGRKAQSAYRAFTPLSSATNIYKTHMAAANVQIARANHFSKILNHEFKAQSIAMARVGASAKVMSAGMSAIGTATRRAASGIISLGGSVLAMGSQFIIAAGIIYAITEALDYFLNKQKDVVAELKNTDVAGMTKDQYEELLEEQEDLQKRFGALDVLSGQNGFLGANAEAHAKEYERIKTRLADIKLLVERYDDYWKKRAVEQASQGENFKILRDLRPEINRFKTDLETIRDAIDKAALSDDEKTEHMNVARTALTGNLRERIATEYNKHIDQMVAKTKTLVDQDNEATQEELENLHAKIEQVRKLRDEQLKAFEMPGGGIDTDDRDNKTGQTRLTQFLDRIEKKATLANARLNQTNEYWEEFKRQAENGFFGSNIKEEIEDLDNLGTNVKRIEEALKKAWDKRVELDNLNEATKEYDASLKSVDSILASIRKTFNRSANQNPFLNESIRAEEYKTRLDDILAKVRELKEKNPQLDTGALEHKLATGKDAADAGARKATLEDIRELSKRLQNELAPAHQKVNLETRKQIANLYEWRQKQGELNADELNVYLSSISALNTKIARESEKPIQTLAREWRENTEFMDQVWADTMGNFVDTLSDGLIEGELRFDSFFKSIASMIIKAQLQQLVGNLVGNFFPGGGGAGNLSANNAPVSLTPNNSFALGGIMTSEGALPLRKYANGGIAHRPQVALYGEGSQPEAYVPLPDGRTIPVTMKGEDKGGQMSNVQLNIINTTSTPFETDAPTPRWDGKQMVLDVVLGAMTKPGKFRDSVRGAVR